VLRGQLLLLLLFAGNTCRQGSCGLDIAAAAAIQQPSSWLQPFTAANALGFCRGCCWLLLLLLLLRAANSGRSSCVLLPPFTAANSGQGSCELDLTSVKAWQHCCRQNAALCAPRLLLLLLLLLSSA
jgi:hypothetical protein